MEALTHVQSLMLEHAFTIGVGLLVATVIAGIVWYWMSRSSVKSDVLENKARLSTVEMAPEPSVNQDTVEQPQPPQEETNVDQ